MVKKIFIFSCAGFLLCAGCSTKEQAFAGVRQILVRMQEAKLSNNCWAYLWYFDHGFTETVYETKKAQARKLRSVWAEKGSFEWQVAVCGQVRGDDITRYRADQPAIFSFPAYEKIENFKLERISNRKVKCRYVLRGFGFDEWIEHDVCLLFKRGMDAEWKVVSLERGPARKAKIEEFN